MPQSTRIPDPQNVSDHRALSQQEGSEADQAAAAASTAPPGCGTSSGSRCGPVASALGQGWPGDVQLAAPAAATLVNQLQGHCRGMRGGSNACLSKERG